LKDYFFRFAAFPKFTNGRNNKIIGESYFSLIKFGSGGKRELEYFIWIYTQIYGFWSIKMTIAATGPKLKIHALWQFNRYVHKQNITAFLQF
jgi:hypothetical protein